MTAPLFRLVRAAGASGGFKKSPQGRNEYLLPLRAQGQVLSSPLPFCPLPAVLSQKWGESLEWPLAFHGTETLCLAAA